MINAYRVERGLEAIPVSRSLTRVAELHVQDLEQHPPTGQCNLHSWSAAGAWSPCCYTADHAQARCMWAKPREITRGGYSGNGYEISAAASGARITPEDALRMWQKSSGHHQVIINQGGWSSIRWQAMGIAMSEHHAVVWFGQETDSGGR